MSVGLDATRLNANHHLLVFAAPRQVVSWTRSESQSGWVVYFKADFLGLTDALLEQRFTFFQPSQMSVQAIPDQLLLRLRGYCEQLRRAFDEGHAYRLEVLRGLLTTFLYECLALYGSEAHALAGKSASEAILWRFRHLLDRNFLTCQSVASYAKLMRITPGHLTEVVRSETGQSASELIAERLFYEAKQLLAHSELTIADVSTHLLFSEPTHFSRFFKRMARVTPRQFRESGRSILVRG